MQRLTFTTMDEKLLQRAIENYKNFDNDTMLGIWRDKDKGLYSEEIFEAIRQILESRDCTIPPQNERTTKSESELQEVTSTYQRQLPRTLAPIIVEGLGALLVFISMFLPHLSATDQVVNITNNMLIQNQPVILLCSLAAVLTSIRFWIVGSKASGNWAIWVGLWFLGWTIYDGYSGQIVAAGGWKLPTSAGAGLWTAGVGCASVFLGGLMMRFPHSGFGLVTGPVITKVEQDQMHLQSKICPRCAETVKAAAMVCRYCGHEFLP